MFKQKGNIEAEIICPACRTINYTGRSDSFINRGAEFQRKSGMLVCEKCSRKLMKIIGEGKVEVKCKYCKKITNFDTKQFLDGTAPRISPEIAH
jgi:phage FluMu protein Com